MKRANKNEEPGSSWIDTYADMITLVLCFFVLLYSISSADEEKWAALVKSMNPDAKEVSIITPQGDKDDEDLHKEQEDSSDNLTMEPSEIEQQFEGLYDDLMNMSQELDTDAEVEIARVEGEIYITYRDKIFFNGDSYILLEVGEETLDALCETLADSESVINEIQIQGHTSQANPEFPNDIYSDRALASMRASVVTTYIQEKGFIPGSKLISMGFGQNRPIDTFETREGRATNRRVEMKIIKVDEEVKK